MIVMKLYCGLDIHKNYHVGCIMGARGKIVTKMRREMDYIH